MSLPQETKTTFVKLIPMKNYDNKIISRRNLNPLQRVNILETAPLREIANFIHDLAFPPNDETFEVALYVKIMDTFSRLPLSINVGELMIMAHQETESELRYSFIEVSKPAASVSIPRAHVPIDIEPTIVRSKREQKQEKTPVAPQIEPPQEIPQPQIPVAPPMPPVPPIPQPTNEVLYNDLSTLQTDLQVSITNFPSISGFSFFNNSISQFQPTLGVQKQPQQDENSSNPAAVSLKNELEKMMKR